MDRSDIIENQTIKISDLRKVNGIGEKTIQRIKETLLNKNDYVSQYDPSIHLNINNIYKGDCLELMNGIPDKSVDMILCDLPYGTTRNKWDSIIPLEPLWEQYERVIKDNGMICLTSSEPFTNQLINSKPKKFKYYDLVWDKISTTGFLNAKRQPLRRHEQIICFYKKQPTYNPIMEVRGKPRNKRSYNKKQGDGDMCYGKFKNIESFNNEYYPTSIIQITNAVQKGKVHPTQKPVALFEYLIKTYTNEGETVLDNCIGSGTTAIAAINTNRNYIGIELDEKYYNIAKNRINQYIINKNLKDRYPLIT